MRWRGRAAALAPCRQGHALLCCGGLPAAVGAGASVATQAATHPFPLVFCVCSLHTPAAPSAGSTRSTTRSEPLRRHLPLRPAAAAPPRMLWPSCCRRPPPEPPLPAALPSPALRCEICGQDFRGDYRDPPPRPPQHPLVAQLQVDNADNRIVLLADPTTGAVVARMVLPPGGDAAPPAGFERWRLDAAEDEDDEEGPRGCGPLATCVCVALLVLILVAFVSAAAEAGERVGGGGTPMGCACWPVAWPAPAFCPAPHRHALRCHPHRLQATAGRRPACWSKWCCCRCGSSCASSSRRGTRRGRGGGRRGRNAPP